MSSEASCGDTAVRVAFVCVQNAGRSQMATAFAERERRNRGLERVVAITTGGTDPAGKIHPVVVDVMVEAGIDLGDRVPRSAFTEMLSSCDVVVTMGCSTLELDVDGVDVRDWDLDDPHGKDLESVRAIRDTVASKVASLFDELDHRFES